MTLAELENRFRWALSHCASRGIAVRSSYITRGEQVLEFGLVAESDSGVASVLLWDESGQEASQADVDRFVQEVEEVTHQQAPAPPRYRVQMSVRFANAADYLQEYAENLSQGGIFVATSRFLDLDEEATLHIELPGLGAYAVDCRVVHVLDEEEAAKRSRRPGIGFEIVSAPEGFRTALSEYLLLLGSRRDTVIFVAPGTPKGLLESAGYGLREAPYEKIASRVLDTKGVIAVLVPRSEALAYRQVLASSDLPSSLVVPYDKGASLESLLNVFDQRARALTKPRGTEALQGAA